MRRRRIRKAGRGSSMKVYYQSAIIRLAERAGPELTSAGARVEKIQKTFHYPKTR
jgi:hypothetical protein